MSTSTLLLCSAWLRGYQREALSIGRYEQPTLSANPGGRERASTSVLRNSQAASRQGVSGLPKDGQALVVVGEAVALRFRQCPDVAAGAAPAPGRRPLTPSSRTRQGSRQFLLRRKAVGPPDITPVRRTLIALMSVGFLLLSTVAVAQEGAAEAQTRGSDLVLSPATVEAARASRIGGLPPGPCVIVDIAGHRVGHLQCASDRLQQAADTAQAQTRAAIDTPVIGAGSSDVQTGVANQTATRQRMGNTFGTSVHPQRPNRPAPPPRGGFRP